MSKIELNRQINQIVDRAISKYPYMRFNQILHGLGVVNGEETSFYDDPEIVLKRVKESVLYVELNERGSFKGVF